MGVCHFLFLMRCSPLAGKGREMCDSGRRRDDRNKSQKRNESNCFLRTIFLWAIFLCAVEEKTRWIRNARVQTEEKGERSAQEI